VRSESERRSGNTGATLSLQYSFEPTQRCWMRASQGQRVLVCGPSFLELTGTPVQLRKLNGTLGTVIILACQTSMRLSKFKGGGNGTVLC